HRRPLRVAVTAPRMGEAVEPVRPGSGWAVSMVVAARMRSITVVVAAGGAALASFAHPGALRRSRLPRSFRRPSKHRPHSHSRSFVSQPNGVAAAAPGKRVLTDGLNAVAGAVPGKRALTDGLVVQHKLRAGPATEADAPAIAAAGVEGAGHS